MPTHTHALDRASVIQHLMHATRSGFSHALADKLLAAYDLGLIVCMEHGDEMQIRYTLIGHEWDLQGQPWGVA